MAPNISLVGVLLLLLLLRVGVVSEPGHSNGRAPERVGYSTSVGLDLGRVAALKGVLGDAYVLI